MTTGPLAYQDGLLRSDPVVTTRKRVRANAEGTVVHDKNRDRWRGAVTIGYDDGKQVRKWVTAKTKKDLLLRLRELQNAADNGQELARRDLTVSTFLAQWLDTLRGAVAPTTEQQYVDVVRLYIKPYIGQKRVRTLSPADVTRMVRTLEDEGRSANTRRLARSILRRALRWGEHEGTVKRNVAAISQGVKLNATEGRTLTPTQARTLLESVKGHRLEAAFAVALSLGLRRGELLGLAWDDVDLDADPPRLTVRHGIKRLKGGLIREDCKTPKSRRTVYLPGPVVEVLRAHRRRQLDERLAAGDLWEPMPLGADLIFRSPVGTAVDPANFLHAVYGATEAAGLGRWSAHELRHSAASLLIAQNVPLKVVSETLGHASIRITADVYGHLLEPAKAEAADAMTEALWGTS